jgi:hypothetical protein
MLLTPLPLYKYASEAITYCKDSKKKTYQFYESYTFIGSKIIATSMNNNFTGLSMGQG